MNETPLVYITMPCYNGEKYLLDQLMSIYYQNYTNRYLIFINDGSTDNSEQIIRDWISHYNLYNKVRVITKENGGVMSAVQKGLEEVKKMCDINNTNCLIAHCDSDDIRTREKLSVQVKYMVEHPECGMSYHDMIGIDINGILTIPSYVGVNFYHEETFLYMSTIGNHYTGPELMFKANYIDKILPMPLSRQMAQDLWTALVLGILGIQIHYINKKLIYHRMHQGSWQRTFERQKKIEQNKIIMEYFFSLKRRFPDKDIEYIISYNNDRLIKWCDYSLLHVWILVLLKYPKIFRMRVKKQIWQIYLYINP